MDNFLIVLSKYYFLSILFLLFGRAFFVLVSKKFLNNKSDNISIYGVSIVPLYPIIGIFVLGNLLYLFNFFVPLKNNAVYFIFLFLLFNFFEQFNLYEIKRYYKYSLLSIFLLVTSYNINFHYDSGLYHLNNQLWLRESNIVMGFSNIYGPFGVSSLYEYVSAFLWFDRSYLLLHLLNILFISTFYIFIIYGLLISKVDLIKSSSFFLLVYSLLDNVGVSGGRNGFISVQSIGKPDVSVAIVFLITSIFIFTSILKNNYIKEELFIFSIFSLLLFQLKVSGSTIVFLYLLYIFNYFKKNRQSFIDEVKILFGVLVAFVFWSIKTIMQTGCLIFPLSSTCFEGFKWVNKNYLKTIEEVTVGFSLSYDFQNSFLNWSQSYFDVSTNRIVASNFLLSIICLLVVRFLFFKKNNDRAVNLTILSYIVFNILFYLRFGPDVRYLMGIQMLIIAALSFSSTVKHSIANFIIISTVAVSLFLVPRLDSYKSFNFFAVPNIDVPTAETKEMFGRLSPVDGDQCWINIDCSASRSNYFIDESEFFKKVYLIER